MAVEKSRGRPAKVTVDILMDELNRLKKKGYAERQIILAREKKLIDEREEWIRKGELAMQEARAAKARPPSREALIESKNAGIEAACEILSGLFDRHVTTAEQWKRLKPDERKKAVEGTRIWAHPFVGYVLKAAVSEVQELKGALDGHSTEEESGAG